MQAAWRRPISAEMRAHPHGQRKRPGPFVRVKTDQRLQKRRCSLIGERNQAHLREIQIERTLQQRINRGQQRRHHAFIDDFYADGHKASNSS